MKKQDLPSDLVKKTVDTLDEVENEVLGVKTGVAAGDTLCQPGTCPVTPYGTAID